MAHILVIDDEPASRDLLRTLLSYQGDRILVAGDGVEGLALARAEQLDLIVTDILMPELDGYAFVAQLRADPPLAHIPVVFYTALDLGKEMHQLAVAAGIVKILTKPAEPEILLAAIRDALEHVPAVMPSEPDAELNQAYLRKLTSTLHSNVEALRAENQARARAEAQLASIIESAMDAIIAVDDDQRIAIWNTAAERLFGCPASEARGQALDRFIPPRYRDAHRAHIRAFGRTRVTNRAMGSLQPLTALRADGTEFSIEASISHVTVEQQQFFTVILRDITARVQAEAALRASWMAEQTARRVAETLQMASRALSPTLDEATILARLLEYLERLVPYDFAQVMLIDADGRLSTRARRGEDDTSNAVRVVGNDADSEAGPLFRALLARQQSLLIADTSEDPPWHAALGMGPAQSWLGVPLYAGGEPIGLYSIEKMAPGFFTADHVRHAEALAAQAAVVLQNAHMFEAVRQGHARLQMLSQRLVTIQEAERRHIARELHDEIGQALTGLRLTLELMGRLPPDAQAARLAEAHTAVQELIGRVRSLSLDLRPAMLDDLGLLPALLWHIRRYTEQTGITVDCQHRGLDRRLPIALETVAYRVVQEALTNVARHAGVTKVDVRLLATPEHLSLRVADAGQGFDLAAALQSPRSSGLLGMQERVMLLGGSLSITAALGAGTEVLADLPIRADAEVEEGDADDRARG